MKLSRRRFVATTALGALGTIVGSYFLTMSTRRMNAAGTQSGSAEVFVIKTSDRHVGVRRLLSQFNLADYHGKTVALKPNFNSADPFPASTHIETLGTLVEGLKQAGVSDLVLAERSGMGNTRKILEQTGVFNISDKLGFKVTVLDENDRDSWLKIAADGTHWLNGFYIPKLFLAADKVVQTCCLKPHRFGGHFTMSLKNSIGLVAKQVPGELYDYMLGLHTSPYQRLMIAEVNPFYNVDLVVMDAIQAFVSGGPERGDLVEPNLMLASRDRVAIDAVGIAILRSYGSTKEVTDGNIFDLEQIRRAVELGVGVNSPSRIKLIPLNDESVDDAKKMERVLKSQG
ncbi:MAG: DUF362 domain-containing protein [Candidatus Bathyarchaeia archaeon]